MHYRQLADYDLQFLEDVLHSQDRKLDKLAVQSRELVDPDGAGLLDSVESTVSRGLVECQLYISQVLGSTKDATHLLSLGPRHSCGHSIAEIVQAGANYVKHHAAPPIHKTTATVLKRLDILLEDGKPSSDYPMSHLLSQVLPSPTPFELHRLLPLLEKWRDALIDIDAAA